MKPTLLVLAAGMGSRYGSLKQLDPLGPSGQTIMDYSIYDAIRAGFGKVVFVIRHDFEDQFREQILKKYEGFVPVEVVFQCNEALPEGFSSSPERKRPWGTNHAVLMGKGVINEPFAVINSDDFYGEDAFRTLARFLLSIPPGQKGRYAMVSFNLRNTTTKNGEVSRGVCNVTPDNHLAKIVECQHIRYNSDGDLEYVDDNGNVDLLAEDSPVSMNFWGFTPDYFEHSEREFVKFLNKYVTDLNREYFIPSVVDKLIRDSKATVEVLNTDSKWFGVTYSEDRENVRSALSRLHREGKYPQEMFAKL